MISLLVPEDFQIPESLETPEFTIRKLCFSDADLDYKAVMSSIDIIKKTRGGDWPSPDLRTKRLLFPCVWPRAAWSRMS